MGIPRMAQGTPRLASNADVVSRERQVRPPLPLYTDTFAGGPGCLGNALGTKTSCSTCGEPCGRDRAVSGIAGRVHRGARRPREGSSSPRYGRGGAGREGAAQTHRSDPPGFLVAGLRNGEAEEHADDEADGPGDHRAPRTGVCSGLSGQAAHQLLSDARGVLSVIQAARQAPASRTSRSIAWR
jgi:hypothetical protein